MIDIKTGYPEWDNYWPLLSGIIEKNETEIIKDEKSVRGYRTPDCPWLWLRDNVHMMLATVYMRDDITSFIDFFIGNQKDDGSFFDFLNLDTEMLRIPTEADVEYLAVIGVYRAWLACGDNQWMENHLPALERGLDYMTSHPWRWDPVHNMPKRACTIDTWDFDIRDGLTGIHWPGKIDDKTHFGIMHGDVSGLIYAWKIMGEMLDVLNRRDEADVYRSRSKDLRERANKLLWNGRFYRHRLPLDDFRVEGVDEDAQLSLSNTYDLNRGFPTPEMARSIIRQYYSLMQSNRDFAEWYSIEPPFPEGVFGDKKLKPGVYVNGGIMPLVGGELARGAFLYGYPHYGVNILQRYYNMLHSTGEAYLWYFRDGSPATREASTSPEAYPTDAWGTSAMAAALIQGLAGVRSGNPGFQAAWLEPHWQFAGIEHADVTLQYPSSGKTFHYTYNFDRDNFLTELTIQGDPLVALHIGFPDNLIGVEAEVDGRPVEVRVEDWELGKATAFRDTIKGELRLRYSEG